MAARRDPEDVSGQHRTDDASTERGRLREGIGQERSAEEDDDEPKDGGPGIPGGGGDQAADHDRERDPRKGRVHGRGLMGRRAPAPDMSASGGCRRR